ncbi:MAG: bifunctional chorismate mutase/prephenate dehydrogenase [Desulfobacterales bacterium]|nr:bifunctional chorismate mutase/prephenate dehydrogenase [Desulfobacterales bacterium]
MNTDHSDFNEEILPLRNNIDQIDSKILSLLARRQEQVEQVVKLKKRHQIPVYHPAREEDLISKLRDQAKRSALDPDFMEDLYRVILRQSRVKQTGQMEHKGVKAGAKVLVVGGSGQMGRLFVSLFEKSGYETRILGAGDWDRAEVLCKGIDLCIVTVPIEITETVIERISGFLSGQTLLADLTSIKARPVEKMLKSHNGPVLGLHPLFGPTTPTFDKQIIVVTPGRHARAGDWLVEQLNIWGAVIVTSSAQEHDEVMEIVQALRHFATFCFGRFLHDRNIRLERTLEFSSPIYRLEAGMVGRLFAQDGAMYSEIIFATPERRQLLKEFIVSLTDHLEMLETNDKATFIKEFDQIARWFGPFSEQAMRESTFLINKLIERF